MLFLLVPSVKFQETRSIVLEFIMFIAFCSPRKKQEIHFVDLQDMMLCLAEKQSVHKTQAKFRFRRHEFLPIREYRILN